MTRKRDAIRNKCQEKDISRDKDVKGQLRQEKEVSRESGGIR